MANLTIAVDDELLRRARIRAAEQGTSVNAVLRDELSRYATTAGTDRAAEAFLALARTHPGASDEGPRWSREELHLERFDQHQPEQHELDQHGLDQHGLDQRGLDQN
ncbi:hypothetical protein [Rathayibacter soli]|uniref:hypothetical protein n=1 Tax=Rathayibacter soli TaxID=3144168 RepID=UPI0027E5440A|nr:hypothetical protein [Glaciibacter superstes]